VAAVQDFEVPAWFLLIACRRRVWWARARTEWMSGRLHITYLLSFVAVHIAIMASIAAGDAEWVASVHVE